MITTHTLSCWTDTAPDFSAPSLQEHLTVDVCVIGAGIAGLTTAYLLAREGRTVAVLDARHPTAGETERTTAHLANAIDDRFYNLERWHGPSGARLAAESHTFAIARIERIVSDEGIDCDFRRVDGYLFSADDESVERLRAELEAARRAGLFDVSLLEAEDAPHPLDRPCLRFPRQAQFDPLRYAHGLMSAIRRLGGKIFSDTRVTEIEEADLSVVQTAGGATVRAGALAVMTNSPINNRVALHTKLAPYRTYVVAGPVPAGTVPPGLFWDTNDPYHYIRTARGPEGNDLLVVGGEDHKTGQEEHNETAFDALEKWAHQHFPMLGAISHRWSGQVMETIDGLAFIGRNPGSHPNCYVATGDSGMGMTHGTLAGIIISDLIQGRANPWAELYDPSRKTLAAALTFAEENLNVARQYLDWGRPHANDDVSDLPPLDGRVVQRGGQKVAVHRDAEGRLHERSAVCRHLGCIVAWNEVEHTWDCPCHGSRFEPTGEVINGPATKGLGAADEPPEPSDATAERSGS